MKPWSREQEEAKQPALIPWKGSEANPPGQVKPQESKKSFSGFILYVWGLIKGYTAEDLSRLKEAGVQQVEGKAKKDLAESEATIAAAAKDHAEAEKFHAEAYSIRKKADSDFLITQVEACERLENAISRVSQKGGIVAFDSYEIMQYVFAEKRRDPNNVPLKEAAQELLDNVKPEDTQP